MNELIEKKPGHRKRIIVGAVVGLVLAIIAIWICTTIYDPLMEDIDDLWVLVPKDVDYAIEIRDFPTFVKGLENRPFFGRLDRNAAFQRWLDRPENARALEGVGRAYREINNAGVELPFDLELLGDFSGRQIIVAGTEPPENSDETPPFVALIKPESAVAIVGVNMLLDESLCDWFIAEQLEGIRVTHHNWGVTLTIDQAKGRPGPATIDVAVARIGNAIVLGTDARAVAKIVRSAAADAVPVVRRLRFEESWTWEGQSESSVNLLVTQGLLAKLVGLHRNYLGPMWGEDLALVFERLFPLLKGPDSYLKVDLDEYAEVRMAVGVESQRDPFSTMEPLDRGDVVAQLDTIMDVVPHHAFGYVYANVHPAELITFCLREPALVDRDKRALWFEEMADKLPRFRTVARPGAPVPDLAPRIAEELRAAFDSEIGAVFFRKDRDEEVPHTVPGMSLVFKMRNVSAVEGLLTEINEALGGDGAGAFEKYDYSQGTLYEIANRTWLDDPVNNRPGFALLGDYFVYTNWFPAIRETIERGGDVGFAGRQFLDYNLRTVSSSAAALLYLDPHGLYAYMDQVKEGWVQARTEITDTEKFQRHQSLEQRAAAERIPEERRDGWIKAEYDRWIASRRREKNPLAVRRDIDTNLDYFRGAFSFFFAHVGRDRDELELSVKLGAAEKD